MQKKILVASVHSAFGELLRLSFEKSGSYEVRLVASCAGALEEIAKNPYTLAVLDADEADSSTQNALAEIAWRFPDLPVILFPPQNNPNHPFVQGLEFKAWLNKPFYLPELLEAADIVSAGRRWAPGAVQTASPSTDFGWVADELEAGSKLSNLLRQECLAAFFFTAGGPMIATAGDLAEKAGEEIAALVSKSWHEEQSSDLVRYTHLESAGASVMLYVAPLEKPLVAALIFPVTTPLTRARAVAVEVMRSLHRQRGLIEGGSQPHESEKLAEIDASGGTAWQAEEPVDGEAADALLLELLASAPSPDPVRAAPEKPDDWLLDEHIVPFIGPEIPMPWEVEDQAGGDRWEALTAGSRKVVPQSEQPTILPFSTPPEEPRTPQAELQRYTIILIPRQADVRLEGVLSDGLTLFIPQVCAANGWNLMDLKIFPEALQWTVEVAAAVSPGYLVRLLRQQSSQYILECFPYYYPTTGEDFWAPGFLIVSGGKTPAPRLLQDFIQQTRRRQGIGPQK